MTKTEEKRPILMVESIEEWTAWLSAHHLEKTHVWLRIRKAKSIKPGIFLAEAVTEALRYGWVDGRLNTIDDDYFWLRFSPRRSDSVWSLINRQRVEAMIEKGTLTPLGHQTVEWGKASGTWQAAYTSYEKTPIPIDFRSALAQDPLAQTGYEAWSNSDKLQALFWIESAKKEETRKDRIHRIIELVRKHGKLSELNKKSE